MALSRRRLFGLGAAAAVATSIRPEPATIAGAPDPVPEDTSRLVFHNLSGRSVQDIRLDSVSIVTEPLDFRWSLTCSTSSSSPLITSPDWYTH